MKLQKNLKELRTAKKLQQKEIAGIIGIKYESYWNWESGRSKPNLEMLIKLASFFNVTVDYLLGLTDIKNTASMEDCEMLKNATEEEMHTIKALLKLNSLQLGQVYGFIQGMLAKSHNF